MNDAALATREAHGPVVDAINKYMRRMGGSPVRVRMLEGRAQLWVAGATGDVTAATSAELLATALHINLSEDGMTQSKLIDVNRAAQITGFHPSTMSQAAKHGELPFEKRGIRYMFKREDVLAWDEAHKNKGGRFQPRKGGMRRNGAPTALVPARTASATSERWAALMHRVNRAIKPTLGTPMQITQGEFCERAVAIALDKLEGKA